MARGFVVIAVIIVLLFSSMQISSSNVDALLYDTDVNLSTVDASFLGEGQFDHSGYAVSGAGDVNGDGLHDILIGAVGDDDGGEDAGHTYLVFGRTSGWSMDADLSSADASFRGERANDFSGNSLSDAGDVNGDGFDDILIAAYGSDETGEDAGQVYLVLGAATGWSMYTDLSDADASFRGEEPGDQAGFSVSGAGDVNGDGLDDILVGARMNDDGGGDAGKAYLILGRENGWEMDTDLSDADASFLGEDEDDHAGFSVSGVGDVNRDGFDDFVIGASLNDEGGFNAGQTYLFLGRPSGWTRDTNLSEADASFLGDLDDYAGTSVARAGDVNGDGYDDIIIGAASASGSEILTGLTYLVLGRSTGWAMDTNLSGADASFWGEGEDDHSGQSVSGAGDVNGDGYDDILIGAYINDSGGSYSGKTYLILGRSSGWVLDASLSTADASFLGEAAFVYSGFSVSGAGDVDGDGYDDVLIGAYGRSEGALGAGQTYLIFPDHNTQPTSVVSLTLHRQGDLDRHTGYAYLNETIDVRLQCWDGDETRINVALVRVTNDRDGITLRLRETYRNSGLFLGNFTVTGRTHERYRWVGGVPYDRITVETVEPPGTSQFLNITSWPYFKEGLPSVMYTQEDGLFEILYEDIWGGGNVMTVPWNRSSTWIDPYGNRTGIGGVPDNGDVGTHWFNITFWNELLEGPWWNVTIIVNNTPPAILTTDVTEVDQNEPYSVDYDSDDDGQGTISWHLDTTASWLAINGTTGVLSGTPTQHDVGEFDVTVSVDDGNGGWTNTSFLLTVGDVPDLPEITTTPPEFINEDESYVVTFEASDPDPGEVLTWDSDDLPGWLEFNPATRVLSGVPANEDVGEHPVNISVTDRTGNTAWLNYTLTVLDVVDPPEITTVDVLTATEEVLYEVMYHANDIDPGDEFTWIFETDAGWLSFDYSTLRLWGTPGEGQDGAYYVNLTVHDMYGAMDVHNFTLTVEAVNDMPIFGSEPPTSAQVGVTYEYHVVVNDVDNQDLVLRLDEAPEGMTITERTGYISWTPQLSQLGEHQVTINVTDGVAWELQRYVVTVTGVAGNRAPSFITTPSKTVVGVGKEFLYVAVAEDEDEEDFVTYALISGPGGMTIGAQTGGIAWTPGGDDVGVYNVSIMATDGRGGLDYQNFTLTVVEDDGGNGGGVEEPEFSNWLLVVLIILVIAILAVVAYWRTR